MTDFAALLKPERGQKAHRIHLVDKKAASEWIARQPAPRRALVEAARFDGETGFAFVVLPGQGSEPFEVVAAVADAGRLSPWCLARLGTDLPEGHYRLASGEPGIAALGWMLGQHRFERYNSTP